MPHFSLFSAYNIELEASEEIIFRKFLNLFIDYNSHTNLSAIRTPEGIIEKHFIDSLMLGNFVELHGKVLDIGSGGGFPGIPLKILFPETDFTLMDSVGKKVRAMSHFIE
jgi:16S rRNA (guanine527-N7)-methyltransferase